MKNKESQNDYLLLLFLADEDLKLALIFEERPVSRRGHRSPLPAANIETLIVADRSMLDFHGEANVKDYILTIMNMVMIHNYCTYS